MTRYSEDSEFHDMGLSHIGALDEAAKAYSGDFPDLVTDAIAYGVSQSLAMAEVSNPELRIALLKGLLALCKNCYRTGYASGRDDTNTVLQANQG